MLHSEVIVEAKREVLIARRRGLLSSPEEAWALAGNHEIETLWSIANRVALSRDASAEELCAYLEKAFPSCCFRNSLASQSIWERDEGFL